jgi:hypothetical protein
MVKKNSGILIANSSLRQNTNGIAFMDVTKNGTKVVSLNPIVLMS